MYIPSDSRLLKDERINDPIHAMLGGDGGRGRRSRVRRPRRENQTIATGRGASRANCTGRRGGGGCTLMAGIWMTCSVSTSISDTAPSLSAASMRAAGSRQIA